MGGHFLAACNIPDCDQKCWKIPHSVCVAVDCNWITFDRLIQVDKFASRVTCVISHLCIAWNQCIHSIRHAVFIIHPPSNLNDVMLHRFLSILRNGQGASHLSVGEHAIQVLCLLDLIAVGYQPSVKIAQFAFLYHIILLIEKTKLMCGCPSSYTTPDITVLT